VGSTNTYTSGIEAAAVDPPDLRIVILHVFAEDPLFAPLTPAILKNLVGSGIVKNGTGIETRLGKTIV
jgi:hypothetical protein